MRWVHNAVFAGYFIEEQKALTVAKATDADVEAEGIPAVRQFIRCESMRCRMVPRHGRARTTTRADERRVGAEGLRTLGAPPPHLPTARLLQRFGITLCVS
jgi:hypothetical protein